MAFNIGSAAAAYARQARSAGFGALEARSQDPGKSFVDMLGQAVSNAIATGRHSETMSARAMAGKVDIGEVVSAVTNAELTLQTAVAIRDRVIRAYQDIISMPI